MCWKKKKKSLFKQILDYNQDGPVNIQDIIDASKDIEKSINKYRETLKNQINELEKTKK